jgi:hypothetical protein
MSIANLSIEDRSTWIKDILREYSRGGEDRRSECLALGKDIPWVPSAVEAAAAARKKLDAAKPKAEAVFISPVVQPIVDPPKVATTPSVETGSLKDRFNRAAAVEPIIVPQEAAGPVVAEAPKPAEVRLPAIVPPALPPVAPSYDNALEAMNERHAVIDNVGGKAVIASWEPSQRDHSRHEVIFHNKESFLLRYSNRSVSVEAIDSQGGSYRREVPLGVWWLNHRHRRQHRGILFLPGGPSVVNDCLNLWQGWGCPTKHGDWSLIERHIIDVVAGGNQEFADYVKNWIAWSIQNPAEQAEVALVLIGRKGAGKGTLVRCLERIFGAHTFQVTSREEVIGKFNGHLQDCILFVADEAYWGGDKRCVGRLQGMITEKWLPIERKGIDLIQVQNRLHVIMLAEPGWVIPAGRFERRYAALAVDNQKQGDKAYFKALHSQIVNGGAEAMFYDLLNRDLQSFHPREIPETLLRNPALQKQQVHTLPPLEQWYFTVLQDGMLPGSSSKKPNTAFTSHLIEQAKERIPRLKWDLSEVQLRNFLVDVESIGIACIKFRSSSANGWSFPPLAECRAAWATRYGSADWDLSEEWKPSSIIPKKP